MMNQVQQITFEPGDVYAGSGDKFTVTAVTPEHVTVEWEDGLTVEWEGRLTREYPTLYLAKRIVAEYGMIKQAAEFYCTCGLSHSTPRPEHAPGCDFYCPID